MEEYKNRLKLKMDEFTHLVYKVTRKFPKEELFGTVSQIRRASLSVILNYIEGYARRKKAVQLNFFEIFYGSLKEAKYLIYFSHKEGFLDEISYNKGMELAEEIGAMLWTEIINLENKIK